MKKEIEKKLKKSKKILIFSLVALVLSAFVFLPNIVFADGANGLTQNDIYIDGISQVIKIVSHIVYVFIWPCLAIAGSALDNSLIYGSFLHLDAALWNIWNIMKNFANFTLGFIFILTIVKNLFAGSFGGSSGDPIKGAKDTIVKTLIAGVLVQMSWFLVAALIDISTILIYAVGGIPLSMLGSYDHEVSDMPIMKLNAEFDSQNLFYYYSYLGKDYSPCLLANKGGDAKDKLTLQGMSGEYIAGREYLYKSNDETEFEPGYCVLNGYLYKYQESSGFFDGREGVFSGYQKSGVSLGEKNSAYLNQLKIYWSKLTGALAEERDACSLVRAYNKEYTGNCEEVCPGFGEIAYDTDVFSGADGFRLKNLMEDSKGWVGPFVTMYSSILRYGDLVINQGSNTLQGNLFGLILNTFFALMLFIPIAILMVLLVIRVGYLWVVVAISPIIVLVEYGLDKSMKDKMKFVSEKFSVGEVLRLIFSPVVVVFVVSLCIIFLATIFRSNPNYDNKTTTLSAFGIEKIEPADDSGNSGEGGGSINNCNGLEYKQVSKETYSILGVVNVTLNAQNYNHGLSLFAWVLVEFLATAMVWFFMKFAIGAMKGKLLGETGSKLMESAGKFLGSVPIVPLPGGKGAIGLSKLKDMSASNILDRHTAELNRLADNDLRERFPWAYPGYSPKSKDGGSGGVSAAEIQNVVTEINNVQQGGKTVKTLNDLSPTSQATLTAMYGGKTEAESKLQTFVDYHTNNTYAAIRQEGSRHGGTPTAGKTNADALKFSKAQLDIAVRSDPNWISWAEGMVSGSVQTSDGVFMVDYLGGKAVPGNQQYEIVDRLTYEDRHFPAATPAKGMESITKNDYDKYSAQEKQEFEKHLKEIEEELAELNDINNKAANQRTQDEQYKLDKLKNLGITQAGIDAIKKALGIS